MPRRIAAATVLAVIAAASPAAGQEPDPAPTEILETPPVPAATETPPTEPAPTEPAPTEPAPPQATPTDPAPGDSPEPGPYGIPMGQSIREDAWCRILLPNRKGDAARADDMIDDDYVDLGQYGHFRISAKRWWTPQSTLDSSGNTHINGLYWTTPLLYTGARRGDTAMVRYFYSLITDWLKGHRSKKTRTWSVTQPIIAGERLWTLTCASDISGGARFVKATRKEARTQVRRFKLGSGTNNTAIHSQGSALAAFCYLDDPEGTTQAAGNLARLADYLVLPDGSDREGSPWYAYYTLRLLTRLAPVYQRCGVPYDPIAEAISRAQGFLAAAVDPDFRLATIGDTHRARLAPKWFPPESPARWAATQGVEGLPPQSLYDVFDGGYVFGRSGWTPVDGRPPTFYSVRISRPFTTAHVHSDLGSITFNSRGQEFLGDPGPYRYNGSTTRRYIVGRSGHSVIRVTALKPKAKPKKNKKKQSALGLRAATAASAGPASKVLATRSAAYDTSCLRDRTYRAATITRCAYYDPAADALIVTDRLRAKQRIRADQRWQIPAGVRTTIAGRRALLRAPTAAATMRLTGGGELRRQRPNGKRPDGWFTEGYGELRRGTVVQRRAVLKKGARRTWTTVIAAGDTLPRVGTDGAVVSVTRDSTAQFVIPGG